MKPIRALSAALLVIAIVAVAGHAFADELVITAKPNTWLLRNTTTTPITNLGRYDTAELCKKAVPAVGKWRCDSSMDIEATLNCAGSTPPTIPLVKDADGNWQEPDAFAVEVGGKWVTLQDLYKPAPAGASTCWVRGLADADTWRVNGNNPAAPFMELVTPGMPPLADQPNWHSTDPTWSDADQVKWDNPVSVAARALP